MILWPWLKPPYAIELFQNLEDAWTWRIRHKNGQILSTSEPYSSYTAAYDTAHALSKRTGMVLRGE